MAVARAGSALFLDVGNFAARRHLTIFSDDAATGERGETKKPNETHEIGAPSKISLAIAVPKVLAFSVVVGDINALDNRHRPAII
ncbi:MAG: hypothetical protein ABJA98_01910 [Acidobacteriota bacterium]